MSVIVQVLFCDCHRCKVEKKQMLIMGYSNSNIPQAFKDFLMGESYWGNTEGAK